MDRTSNDPKPDTLRSPTARGGRWCFPGWVLALVVVALPVAGWFLPGQKPGAVLGRLSYLQFWTATLLTGVALSLVTVLLVSRTRRRRVAFQMCALWLGILVASVLAECAAWFLPVRDLMDNPWYLLAPGGTSPSKRLPFERPAHLSWTGLSRGDLALLNGDNDPYAREVSFKTDGEGFRNPKVLQEADIVIIGDSYTEAGNVPEAEIYPTLVGKKLRLVVDNLGRAGYTTPTELIVLKRYGLKCSPKLVIWQLAEANDLVEVLTYQHWVARGRRRYFAARLGPEQRRRLAWQRRSPTYRVFSLLRKPTLNPRLFSGNFQGSEDHEQPVRFLYSSGLDKAAVGNPGWGGLTNALAKGIELCRSNQIQVLVVLIPDKFRVLRDCTRFTPALARKLAQLPGLTAKPSFGTMVEAFCAAQQVPFVDATKRLQRQAEQGELVYRAFDTHLSAAGHRAVADLIVETVRRLKLNFAKRSHHEATEASATP